MTFASNLRQRLGPRQSSPETAPQVCFLLDAPAAVQTQQVLAALDLLAGFTPPGTVLEVTVVHRQAAARETLEWFDTTPGLRCRHIGLDTLSTGGSAAALGSCWRDYAALAVAAVVQTPFYLVLDATSVCIRPFDPAALVENGQAVTAWEAGHLHADNSATAKALLGARHVPDLIVSTFPFVLARDLASKALQRVELVNRVGAAEALATAASQGRPWSANALYSIAAGAELGRYHRPTTAGGATKSLHGDANIWTDEADLKDWDPVGWRRLATHGQFLVIQGNEPARLRAALSKCYSLVDA